MTDVGRSTGSARKKTMSHISSTAIRPVRPTGNAGSRTRRNRSALIASVLVSAALGMAACTSGPDSHLQSASTKPKQQSTTITGNANLPANTSGTQQKILSAWLAADETFYTYMQEPPAPLRADLVAGQTTADLFPELAEYFVNPALQSEGMFLLKLKMQLLNGPTSYNLGHPTVTALTATTATVAYCTSDNVTTTATGQPGPLTLDGGAGGARGTSDLELVSGSWLIASGQSTGVTKC
jgi:hypothetical protein